MGPPPLRLGFGYYFRTFCVGAFCVLLLRVETFCFEQFGDRLNFPIFHFTYRHEIIEVVVGTEKHIVFRIGCWAVFLFLEALGSFLALLLDASHFFLSFFECAV